MRVILCYIAAVLFLALAAISAKAELEPGDLMFVGCDELYAQGAMDAAKLNEDNNCGFTSPRFSASREAHVAWCESHSLSEVNDEIGKRTRQINSCTSCRAHARKAMSQLNLSRALTCTNNKGLLFDPDEQGHFGRCYALVFPAYGDDLDEARRTVANAERLRDDALKTCVRQLRRPDKQTVFTPEQISTCRTYAFQNQNAQGPMNVETQLKNKCAPPDDGSGRWSRDLYQHWQTCLLAQKGDINVGMDVKTFLASEMAARQADLKERASATDCDGSSKSRQPLTLEQPKITDPEGPRLDVRRVKPRLTDPEGPSLKTPRSGQRIVPTGGSDGSKNKDQYTNYPAKPLAPKPTGGSDGSKNCGSAMDRLSGCIPAGAGGGAILTSRDASRPPLAGGGGGARSPAATPAPVGGGATGGASNDGPGLKGGARLDGGTFKIRSGGSIVPAPAPAQEKWRGNVN